MWTVSKGDLSKVTYTRIYLEWNVAPVCRSTPECSLHLAGLVCWPWLAQHSPSVHPRLGIVAARHGILASSHDHCCLQQRSTHLCSESSAATEVSVWHCACAWWVCVSSITLPVVHYIDLMHCSLKGVLKLHSNFKLQAVCLICKYKEKIKSVLQRKYSQFHSFH